MQGLADAYFNIAELEKAKNFYLEVVDISKKIGNKEEYFELHTTMKLN